MADLARDFLIRIISDASKAKTDLDYTRNKLITLEETAKGVGSKLGDIERVAKIDQLGSEMGQLALKTKNVDEAVTQLTERLHQMGASTSEIDRATAAFKNAQDAAGKVATGGGKTGGINLARIGGQLRQLPSTPIPGTGLTSDAVANVIRMGGAFQQIGGSADAIKEKALAAAQAIGIGNIGAVASIAALAVVIKLLQASTDAARAAAQKDIDARQNAIKLLVEGNQQEIQSRINTLAKEREIREAQQRDAVQQLALFRESVRQEYGAFRATIGEVDALLGTNNGELVALKNNVDSTGKALNQTSTEFDLLTGLTHLSAQSAEELAKAEASLTLRRKAASLDIAKVEDQLSAAKEVQQQIDSGTAEGLEKRKKAIYDELLAIGTATESVAELFRKADGDKEKQEQYRAEIDKLNAQFQTLSRTYDALSTSTVELAVKNNDAIKLNKDAQKDLDKIGADFANAETKRQSDLQSIADKTAESYRKLKESFDQSNAEAVIKANEDLAKSTRTRADEDVKNQLELQYKLSKVGEDTKEAAIKAAISREEAVAKIERDFGRSRNQAIQDRDAVALAAAEQKKADELDDAQKSYKKDIKQSQDNADKKRKELEADFQQARKIEALQRAAQDRERDIAYDNERAARRRQYQFQQDQIQSNARAEILARNNAYIKTISDLQKFLQDYKDAHAGIFGDVLAYANKLASDIRKALGGNGGSSKPGSGVDFTPAGKIPPSGRLVPTFDTGGIVSRSGYAWVDQHEVILNQSQQKQLGGLNMPINVNIKGGSRAEMKKIAIEQFEIEFDKVMDEAEY